MGLGFNIMLNSEGNFMRIHVAKMLVLMVVACLVCPTITLAKPPLKVGLLGPFTGHFAAYGEQMELGIRAYMELNGEQVAGRQITLLTRDTTGVAPDVAAKYARQLVQEDKVDFLIGLALAPNALAVAPIVCKSRTPTILFNATSAGLTERSPYFMRVSFELPPVVAPLAKWAAGQGMKRVYTLVGDYDSGRDAERAFVRAFAGAGGEVVGSAQMPIDAKSYDAYLQRAVQDKPEAVFVSFPPPALAFMAAVEKFDLQGKGIKLLSTGDIVSDYELPLMGDGVNGVISAFHYSETHDSAENKRFLAAYRKIAGPGARPSFLAVQAFDGMAALYQVMKQLNGRAARTSAVMAALRKLRFESPRGAIAIEPRSRDILQTTYIRRTEKRDQEYYNVEVESFPPAEGTPAGRTTMHR